MPARRPTRQATAAGGVPVAGEPVKAAAEAAPAAAAEPAKPSSLAALGKIRKTIAVVIGANATWATAALTPNAHVTIPEWIALGIANATALGVYSVANDPQQPVD